MCSNEDPTQPKINKMRKKKEWAKDFNRHLTEKDIQMANKHMKKCSTSYDIREMQIKKYLYTPIKMAKIQDTDNTKC